MCVYLYVCIYLCVCVCAYACGYICVCVCVCVCISAYICLRVCVYMALRGYVNVCISLCACACVSVCGHEYVCIYVCECMCVYICTCEYMSLCVYMSVCVCVYMSECVCEYVGICLSVYGCLRVCALSCFNIQWASIAEQLLLSKQVRFSQGTPVAVPCLSRLSFPATIKRTYLTDRWMGRMTEEGDWFVQLVVFYGVSTLEGYLMPDPVHPPTHTHTHTHTHIYICMEVNKAIKTDSIKKSWKNKIIQNLMNLLRKSTFNVSVLNNLLEDFKFIEHPLLFYQHFSWI